MRKFLIWSILVMTMMIPMTVSADTGSATLETVVAAQTISFGVAPTLGFGTVVVGTDSQVATFTISNTGNVPLTVTAGVTGSALYTNFMQLQQGTWDYAAVNGWTSPVIAVGGSLIIHAKIVKPSAEYIGAKSGTLTFTSIAVIP